MASAGSVLGESASDSPVAKVITLLEDLKTEVEGDATAEAKTYDEFACFCKDTTDQKSTAIKEDQDSIDELSAEIQDKTAEKNTKLNEVEERQKKQEEMAEELGSTRTRCLKEHADYEATSADLSKAISSLEGAIKVIEAAKPAAAAAALIQSIVQQSVSLSNALKQQPTVAALLQGAKVDPNSPEYKSHVGGIVAILDKLLVDFEAQKKERDTEWEKASTSCDEIKKSITDQMEANDNAIKTLKEKIETLKKEIAEARENLLTAESTLKDDELYMQDLTKTCETRAKDWDQRAQMRADEIKALTQALDILKNDVKDLDAEVNKRALLLEHGHSAVRESRSLSSSSASSERPLSFLQEPVAADGASSRAKAMNLLEKARIAGATLAATRQGLSTQAQKDMVVDLLNREGLRLKSSTLAALVMHVSEDPFVKVKALIQSLIQKLLAESAAEATKKGFCDTEIGKAMQDRDFRYADVEKLNADLSGLEAKKDELEQEIDALAKSLKELNASLAEATKLRADEKAQNLDTIKKGKEGLEAVTKAIVLLKIFYKKSAKAKVLLQASPVDEDTSGPGFDGAYKGKQEGSKAIFVLLETIKADFQRTVKTTQATEKRAAADFVEFDRITKADIGGKETNTELDEQDLESTKNNIAGKMKDLKGQMELVDDAVKAIQDLKPACMDTGMNFKERKAQREEEIAALKKAVCLLDEDKVDPECKKDI